MGLRTRLNADVEVALLEGIPGCPQVIGKRLNQLDERKHSLLRRSIRVAQLETSFPTVLVRAFVAQDEHRIAPVVDEVLQRSWTAEVEVHVDEVRARGG